MRRVLVATSSLVLVHVHSPSALAGLGALGSVPSRSAVIPYGPLAPVLPGGSMRAHGSASGPRQVLFFGKFSSTLEYKAVEDLLAAFTGLPTDAGVRLVVVGQCDDLLTRATLSALAQANYKPVVLRLERIPDRDVASVFESADVVALPYRHVTTSGCVMLALAYGRPLIVPESGQLHDSQAAFSKDLSPIRAAAERAVACVKVWRMLSEEGGRRRTPMSKCSEMLAAVTGLFFLGNYYTLYE